MAVNKEECEYTRLSNELYDLISEGQSDRTLIKLANLILEKIGPAPKERKHTDAKKPKTMNDIMAKAFEKEKIPWGEYKNAYPGQVPIDYLEWLAESNEFIENLRRYLKSKMFQERKKSE